MQKALKRKDSRAAASSRIIGANRTRSVAAICFAVCTLGYCGGVAALEQATGAAQNHLPQITVEEATLRADASEYPVPVYPAASVQSNHAGKVVVDVVVAPASKTSPLARVLSTKVVETPDQDMADAVLKVLKDARFMPFFDDKGNIVEASSRVVWEFRINGGNAEVIDPHAIAKSSSDINADDLKIIQRARQILSSEAVWNRADNRQCPPTAKTISLYCALEKATLDVTGGFDHRGNVMEDARTAIDTVSPHHPDYNHWLMGYNNDPSTTFADIQRLMQVAEEQIAKRNNH
jgi:hypothetical protein